MTNRTNTIFWLAIQRITNKTSGKNVEKWWNTFDREIWSVFTNINKFCFLFSLILCSTSFCCCWLRYDQQSTRSAGIYARTGMGRECSWGFVCALRVSVKGGRQERRGGFFEQRGGKPARKKDSDPHSPARSLSIFFYFFFFFFFFLSLTYFYP